MLSSRKLRSKKRTGFALALVLLLLTLFVLLKFINREQPPQNPTSQLTVSPLSGTNQLLNRPTTEPKVAVLEAIPPGQSRNYSTPNSHDQIEFSESLRGTDIDGALTADLNGNLVLDQGVRDFFDYFLSAADELGPEAAIGEIQRYINDYLPSSAVPQAQALLANYLRYKQYETNLKSRPLSESRLAAISNEGDSNMNADALVVLRSSFDSLKKKRTELFSTAESQALFGLEEAYQNHTLASLELLANQNLSDQQRTLELENLEANLPEQLQASRRFDAQHRQEQNSLVKLNKQINDDSQYHQALTEQGVGHDKADELLGYRQQQIEFDSLYQNYRSAAAAIDINAETYQQSLTQLRQSFFSSPEQVTQAKLRDLTSK